MSYTYIIKIRSGKYHTFDEPLNPTFYRVGETWEDYLSGVHVLLNEKQVKFHKTYPEATIEQVWNMYIPSRTLEQAKTEMLAKIKKYDSSSGVNCFYLNGAKTWLTPTQRSNFLLTLESAKALGVPTVPYLGTDIPIEEGIMAIHRINLYAAQCVAVTNAHKDAVKAMDNVEDVDLFNYAADYPEKVRLEFGNNE